MGKDTSFVEKMATNAVSREDPFPLPSSTRSSSTSSSPIPSSDHLGPTIGGSGSNSLQNDAGFLPDLGASTSTSSASWSTNEAELGAGFREGRLCGSVQFYERHVFLCYKNPSVWPPRVDASEFDRLPRLLSAAVLAGKGLMKRETRLTICEGHDGTETSNGDILIFPDMIRYRRLTHFDVDTFVEEVLVKNGEWLPGTPETLKGSYVFVCCHGSKDRRCGVCGPAIISRFREEIEARSLQGLVSVSPCSHIGGHKYAGNLIIFSNLNGGVTGHWYGYVTPDDVPTLLEQHIGKGEIVDQLWRGQMGLTEEEQILSEELRLQLNGEADVERSEEESSQRQEDLPNAATHGSEVEGANCCQQNGESSCNRNPVSLEKNNADAKEMSVKVTPEKKTTSKKPLTQLSSSSKGSCARKVCSMPTWFESWECEDTYAALAVVCAAVSVAVAYSCYRQLE